MYYIQIPPNYWGKHRAAGYTTLEQERHIAQQIAQYLREKNTSDIYDRDGWVAVAEAQKCKVYGFYNTGGKSGEYFPQGFGEGTIIYNVSLTPRAQAHVLVHEIAHHLLTPYLDENVMGRPVPCGYDDDPKDLRQRICRIVEAIIFGC